MIGDRKSIDPIEDPTMYSDSADNVQHYMEMGQSKMEIKQSDKTTDNYQNTELIDQISNLLAHYHLTFLNTILKTNKATYNPILLEI